MDVEIPGASSGAFDQPLAGEVARAPWIFANPFVILRLETSQRACVALADERSMPALVILSHAKDPVAYAPAVILMDSSLRSE